MKPLHTVGSEPASALRAFAAPGGEVGAVYRKTTLETERPRDVTVFVRLWYMLSMLSCSVVSLNISNERAEQNEMTSEVTELIMSATGSFVASWCARPHAPA
jgi:hypothetical protein